MVLVDDLCDGIFRFDFATLAWRTVQLAKGSQKPATRSYFTFTKVSESAAEGDCVHIMTSGKRVVPINVNHAWVLKVYPLTDTAEWFLVNITSAARPAVRLASNAVSLQPNSLLLFGGSVQSTMSFSDLWELRLVPPPTPNLHNVSYAGQWRELSRASKNAVWPLARHAHAMTVVDSDHVAVFGGRRYISSSEMIDLGVDLNYVFLDEMALFTVSTGKWQRMSNTNRIQRSSHALFSHANRVFTFGGYRRGKVSTFQTNDVLMSSSRLELDLPCGSSSSTGSSGGGIWCNTTDGTNGRPQPRFEFASVQRNNTIVVCGGLSLINGEQTSLQDVWVYDMSMAESTGVAVPRPDTVDDDAQAAVYTSSMYALLGALLGILVLGLLLGLRLRRTYRQNLAESTRAAHEAAEEAGRLQQLQQQQQAQQPQGPVGASEETIKSLPVRPYLGHRRMRSKDLEAQTMDTVAPAAAYEDDGDDGDDDDDDGDSGSASNHTTTLQQPPPLHVQGEEEEEEEAVADVTAAVDDDDSEACAICLVDYEVGEDVRELPCVHYFHAGCVDQWLGRNNACPMCKRSVDGGSLPSSPGPAGAASSSTAATSAAAAAAAVAEAHDDDEEAQNSAPEPQQQHHHGHSHGDGQVCLGRHHQNEEEEEESSSTSNHHDDDNNNNQLANV